MVYIFPLSANNQPKMSRFIEVVPLKFTISSAVGSSSMGAIMRISVKISHQNPVKPKCDLNGTFENYKKVSGRYYTIFFQISQ